MSKSFIVLHAFLVKKKMSSLLFVDVIMQHMKVLQEAQEAKRQVGDTKQEAETGSVKTAESELTSQLDSGEHKDTEPKEDASSQGKCELYIQNSLFYFSFTRHFS